MDTQSSTQREPLQFGLTLFISLAFCVGGTVIDQIVRWTNPWEGFRSGLISSVVIGILWCMFLLPWSLMIFGLYRRWKWTRFRAHWVIGPALLIFIMFISGLIASPPTPQHRFMTYAKTSLPTDASNLSYRFQGGCFLDH